MQAPAHLRNLDYKLFSSNFMEGERNVLKSEPHHHRKSMTRHWKLVTLSYKQQYLSFYKFCGCRDEWLKMYRHKVCIGINDIQCDPVSCHYVTKVCIHCYGFRAILSCNWTTLNVNDMELGHIEHPLCAPCFCNPYIHSCLFPICNLTTFSIIPAHPVSILFNLPLQLLCN